MSSRLFSIAIGSLLAFFFYNATPQTTQAEEIKIGVMLHLSGDFSAWGTAYLEGINLAKDQVNNSGGIKGKKIALVIEDTRFDSKLTASASQKLLTVDRVPLALVSTFTEVMVAGPMFQRANIPLVVIGDSGGEIENIGNYVFSVGTWVKGYSLSASQYFATRLKNKRIAILCTDNPWSQSNGKTFEEDFKNRGGTVVYRADVNPSDSNFRPLLDRIRRENAEGIFAPITAGIVPFFKQAHDLKVSIPIVAAAAALDADIVSAAPEATEGRYVTNSYLDAERPEAMVLLRAYRKKFGKDPIYPSVTARGWDGLMAAAHVLQAADKLTPEGIKESLTDLDFEAAGFRLKIDGHGTAALPVKVLQVQKGILRRVE